MSSDCRIRRATEADVEEVTDLFVSYLEFYRRGCEPSSAKNFICERLAKGDSEIFLATTSSGAVAFVQLYPAFSSLSMKRIWILNDMYVQPAARKQGVGGALLARVKKFAVETGAAYVTLETAADNSAARQLYEQNGYQESREFLHYELLL
jgi:GNAT superfamily N-acetyltransferase